VRSGQTNLNDAFLLVSGKIHEKTGKRFFVLIICTLTGANHIIWLLIITHKLFLSEKVYFIHQLEQSYLSGCWYKSNKMFYMFITPICTSMYKLDLSLGQNIDILRLYFVK